MPIYIDVLVVLNIFINYFILLCSKKVSNVPVGRFSVAGASILGGLFSVIIILPQVNIWLNIIIKLVVSLAITAAAFRFSTFRQFIRCFFSFMSMNFAFAGIMLALFITVKPSNMALNNGTVYFNISIPFFIVSALFCYGAVNVILYFTKRKSQDSKIYTLSISLDTKTAVVKALLDTGNSLCDSFTGKPVTTIESTSINRIIENAEITRFGVIPVNTVTGSALMKTVRADFMTVTNDKERYEIKNPVFAISTNVLSDGEYTVLLNNELLSGGKSYKKTYTVSQ